jgi:hypothetical protein
VNPAEIAWWIGLTLLVTGCTTLAWWLFLSPIANAPAVNAQSPFSARVVAIPILIYFVLGTAGIADASWHMTFGIAGTTRDFWSPPHLAMYGSFGAIAAFTAFALSALMGARRGVRENFRAQPLLGAFFLISVYQLGSGPVDELYHSVHGIDLTAWAPPHLIIVSLAAVALAILGSLYGAAVTRPTRRDALIRLIPFAVILWTTMGVAIGDWEFTLVSGAVPPGNPLWDRPSWQYIVAGVIPGSIVLGAAASLLESRWSSVAVVALMIAWSFAAFAAFAALGSSMPSWTTPLAYLAGALVVDIARTRPALGTRPLVLGLLFAVTEFGVATALIVFGTRLVELTTSDVVTAALVAIPLGSSGHVIGRAVGRLQRTLPERIATASRTRRAAAEG